MLISCLFSCVISRFNVFDIWIASGDRKCFSLNSFGLGLLVSRGWGDLTAGVFGVIGGGRRSIGFSSAAISFFKSLDMFPSPPRRFFFGTNFSFRIVIFLGVVDVELVLVEKFRFPWLIISFSPDSVPSRPKVPFLDCGGVFVAVVICCGGADGETGD